MYPYRIRHAMATSHTIISSERYSLSIEPLPQRWYIKHTHLMRVLTWVIFLRHTLIRSPYTIHYCTYCVRCGNSCMVWTSSTSRRVACMIPKCDGKSTLLIFERRQMNGRNVTNEPTVDHRRPPSPTAISWSSLSDDQFSLMSSCVLVSFALHACQYTEVCHLCRRSSSRAISQNNLWDHYKKVIWY